VVVGSRRPPRQIKDLNPLDHPAQAAAAAAGEEVALSLCGSLESEGARKGPVVKNEELAEKRLVVMVYREVECIALVLAGHSEIVKETHINRTMNYSTSFKNSLFCIQFIHRAHFAPCCL
jgi:hypothetical protein